MTRRRIIPVVLLKQLLPVLFIGFLFLPQTGCSTPQTEPPPTFTTAPTADPNGSSATEATPPPTATAAALGLLGAPAGLSVETGNTVIRLTWQPVQGAVGYVVFRDDGERPLNAMAFPETTYLDIGLTNGRTYRYTIAAVNANGEISERSQPISAAPRP
ncbi:MAG: fibronectin type III domain-containing protein [Chloroflexi bacterium CFX4]|nr:fibronectin type III domain-containing protein [Chloroflexi bacterium CFX4]MDL1922354.1 fibronectin type III domain-containing protein [Chloroflexi bacterium CFX3]